MTAISEVASSSEHEDLRFAAISAGTFHSRADSTLSRMVSSFVGVANSNGQLGDGNHRRPGTHPSPAVTSAGSLVFSTVVTGYAHTCALAVSIPGVVYCWVQWIRTAR